MTINKQALRKAALHAKITSDWGLCADNFHDRATPDVVLSLLDELDKWQQESSAWQAVAEKQLALAIDADANTAELVAAGIITKVGE